MDYLDDAPILSKSDDRLSRAALAERIACDLSTIRSDRSVVIGLSGPWGSGKTSFLNMIEQYLKYEMSSSCIPFIRFNPWLIENEDALLGELLAEIRRGIEDLGAGPKAMRREDISKTIHYLDRYELRLIDALGNNVATMIAGIVGDSDTAILGTRITSWALKVLLKIVLRHIDNASKTMEQSKAELVGCLKRLDGNIVVVIDDVDRLSDSSIRKLVKLVALTASLPHIIYILSYDKRVMEGALSGVQSLDGSLKHVSGREYLDKVVQIPIELPPMSRLQTEILLETSINATIEASPFDMDEDEKRRLISVADCLVIPSLTTPRALTRFKNVLNFRMIQSGKEICPADLIGMSALEVFKPEIYSWIWRHRSRICSDAPIDFAAILSRGNNKIELPNHPDDNPYGDELDNIILNKGLSELFPRVGQDSPETIEKLRRSGRVACSELLLHYFGHSDEQGITRAVREGILHTLRNQDLSTALNDLFLQGQLLEIIQDAISCAGSLTPDRTEQLIMSFTPYLGSGLTTTRCTPFTHDADELITKFIYESSKAQGPDGVSRTLSHAFATFSPKQVVGFSNLIGREAYLRMNPQETDKPCLTDSYFLELSQGFISKMHDSEIDFLRLCSSKPYVAWKTLDELHNQHGYENYVARIKKNAPQSILFSAAMLRTWHGAEGRGFEIDENLCIATLEDFKRLQGCNELEGLPTEVLIRVSSLYYLLASPKSDGEISEKTVLSKLARRESTQQ